MFDSDIVPRRVLGHPTYTCTFIHLCNSFLALQTDPFFALAQSTFSLALLLPLQAELVKRISLSFKKS